MGNSPVFFFFALGPKLDMQSITPKNVLFKNCSYFAFMNQYTHACETAAVQRTGSGVGPLGNVTEIR